LRPPRGPAGCYTLGNLASSILVHLARINSSQSFATRPAGPGRGPRCPPTPQSHTHGVSLQHTPREQGPVAVSRARVVLLGKRSSPGCLPGVEPQERLVPSIRARGGPDRSRLSSTPIAADPVSRGSPRLPSGEAPRPLEAWLEGEGPPRASGATPLSGVQAPPCRGRGTAPFIPSIESAVIADGHGTVTERSRHGH
jgi:hypothetical protein